MVREKVRIVVYGENFYPSKISSIIDVHFENEISPGDIGRIGRYKGKPIPYGSASINAPNGIINPIRWILHNIKDKIQIIRNYGGDDIQLNVAYYYNAQCNCELGLDEIALLSEMKIPFVFSVYEDEGLVDK
jgi:hypothetical protein